MSWFNIQDYVNLYANVVSRALPIAFVFGMGNVLCNMVCSAAFHGRLTFGSDK